MNRRKTTFLVLFFVAINCNATEAGKSISQFNVQCPATTLGPIIDNYYHECHSGIIKNEYNSCEKFLDVFKKLMPEYDCARPIDISGDKKYTVPAIWLLGDGQSSDYHTLVHDLSFKEMYSRREYKKARNEAESLFFSPEFKKVLDAAGEEYEDEWEAHEKNKEAPIHAP